jgi:hypothetical protein
LLLGLISAAMQAATKPPEMREEMAKMLGEMNRMSRELEKRATPSGEPQPAARYAAEPADAVRPYPPDELATLQQENAARKKQLQEAVDPPWPIEEAPAADEPSGPRTGGKAMKSDPPRQATGWSATPSNKQLMAEIEQLKKRLKELEKEPKPARYK